MREIKFRALTPSGRWVYGSMLIDPYGTTMMVYFDRYRTEIWAEVTPETVGQFTGLTDEKGVEVYEGDIFDNGDVVAWQDCGFVLQNKMGKFPLWKSNIEGAAVVGNIHDNKESAK